MYTPLSKLLEGEVATVVNVSSGTADSALKHLFRRLAELGFMPGETVKMLRKSLGGEPIAVRIGNSTFALRRHEAEHISVELVKTK